MATEGNLATAGQPIRRSEAPPPWCKRILTDDDRPPLRFGVLARGIMTPANAAPTHPIVLRNENFLTVQFRANSEHTDSTKADTYLILIPNPVLACDSRLPMDISRRTFLKTGALAVTGAALAELSPALADAPPYPRVRAMHQLSLIHISEPTRPY